MRIAADLMNPEQVELSAKRNTTTTTQNTDWHHVEIKEKDDMMMGLLLAGENSFEFDILRAERS